MTHRPDILGYSVAPIDTVTAACIADPWRSDFVEVIEVRRVLRMPGGTLSPFAGLHGSVVSHVPGIGAILDVPVTCALLVAIRVVLLLPPESETVFRVL